ncbi:hypothetical protein TrVE_jg9387 [Triparma verrucosa]|uniref:Peptidase S26 domain-containing protein n=2 Tax=Triparma TaxID=722752 RepID=A0A9W7C0S4_9STRA|nr:hypothetical protein TrVE_jg9387 [Triparma verrucosa]GMH99876.1 hypothetical protein TrST_g9159 [Triparma strigata]
MSPTLPDQSLFLTTTLVGKVEIGSVVVLKDPNHFYTSNHTVLGGGILQDAFKRMSKIMMKAMNSGAGDIGDDNDRLLVKRVASRNPINNKLWLRGDNPDKSEDSRKWGEVREGMVVETVLGRIWPYPSFSGFTDDKEEEGMGDEK